MAIINVDTVDMMRAELQGGGTVLVDYGAP